MTSKTEAITPEIMPKDSNLNLVSNLDSNDRVLQYHYAAERCANMSIWCAAMAGAELSSKKKAFGHGGGWTEYRDALPFSNKTASNYMHLAEQLESRLNALPADRRALMLPAVANAQAHTESLLQLLNLPSPMDVFNPAHEQIAAIIRDVTSGKTITQLYFDWEICTPPRQLGGNPALQKWLNEFHPRIHATRPDELSPKLQKEFETWCADQDAEAAKNYDPVAEAMRSALFKFLEIKTSLYAFMHGYYADLPRKELEELKDLFGDYCNQVEGTLKG